MGVYYLANTVVVKESKYQEFVAGKRCPDLTVNLLSSTEDKDLTTESEKRLYALVSYGKFTVLLLGLESGRRVVAENLVQRYEDKAQFWQIHNDDICANIGLLQFRADWNHNDEDIAIVIRPDLYVGYTGTEWQQYLDVVFSP
jgi:phenol 2-monooxygenase